VVAPAEPSAAGGLGTGGLLCGCGPALGLGLAYCVGADDTARYFVLYFETVLKHAFGLSPPPTDPKTTACCIDMAASYNQSVAGPLMQSMTVTCTNCGPELTSLGVFPSLVYLADDTTPSLRSSIYLSCTNCTHLTTMGLFGALILVAMNADASITLSCTDCPALTGLGEFPVLTEPVETQIVTQVSIGVTCTRCGALVSLASLPSLSRVAMFLNLNGAAAVNSLDQTSKMTYSCVDCPSLVTFGLFPWLGMVVENALFMPSSSPIRAKLTGYLSVGCTRCASLTSIGEFAVMRSVARSAGSTARTFGLLSVSCDGCPLVTAVGTFPRMTFVGEASESADMFIGCTNCTSLPTLGTLPLLESVYSSDSLPNELAGSFVGDAMLSLTCGSCASVSSLGGTFTTLVAVRDNQDASYQPQGMDTSTMLLMCMDCPMLAGVTAANNFPVLSVSSPHLKYIELVCTACAAAFAAAFPIYYTFSHTAPLVFSAFSDGCGLTLSAVDLSETGPSRLLLASLANVVRLDMLHLSQVNVSTLDGLALLSRVDQALTIENCGALRNIDGLTTNLRYVESVTIRNNAVLCNIDQATIKAVSQTNPVIADNNGDRPCARLLPAQPGALEATEVTPTSLNLSWPVVPTSSVAVLYTLTMGPIVLLNYYAYQQVLVPMPLPVTQLSPDTVYTFVLSATLNGVSLPSDPLIVRTLAPSLSPCPPGYGGNSPGNCTLCPAGSFSAAANNGSAECALCPPGTASDSPGASSFASACAPCAYGSAATEAGSATCTACASDTWCPVGAASLLSAPVVAQSANTTIDTSTSVSMTGYDQDEWVTNTIIILCVFSVCGAALLVMLAVFRHRSFRVVTWFARLINTPLFLLRVRDEDRTLEDPPSFGRGLIGVAVAVTLLFVTAYQLNNFALNQYGDTTSLQPGAMFSNGQPISTAPTQFNASVSLIASPVHCASEAYTFSAQLGDQSSATPVGLRILDCDSDSLSNTTTIVFGTPPNTLLQLSSVSSTDFVLRIDSTTAGGNAVFTPVLSYSFVALLHDQSILYINETIVAATTTGAVPSVITGTTTVSLAGVGAEHVSVDDAVTNTGFTFSYIGTTTTAAATPEAFLAIDFHISVPSNFLQVRQVELMSPLILLSGLLAIGGGVLSAGTIIAYSYALGQTYVRAARRHSKITDQGEPLLPQHAPAESADPLDGAIWK